MDHSRKNITNQISFGDLFLNLKRVIHIYKHTYTHTYIHTYIHTYQGCSQQRYVIPQLKYMYMYMFLYSLNTYVYTMKCNPLSQFAIKKIHITLCDLSSETLDRVQYHNQLIRLDLNSTRIKCLFPIYKEKERHL